MLVFLKEVFSWLGIVFVCYLLIAGAINAVWFVLHLIFPKRIKYDFDIDLNDESGRYDGWSH